LATVAPSAIAARRSFPDLSSPEPLPDLPQSEPALLRSLLQNLLPGSSVFLGNSLPIRECNEVASALPPGVTFHANRGANGIDGLISTWLGLSGDASAADAWLILGDLSALYDLAGLWVLPQLGLRRRFLVIVNNGGGKIFSRVPGLRSLPGPGRALIENQHTLTFEPLAALWGLTHSRITRVEECLSVLRTAPSSGTHLLELCPDPNQTETCWAASP
jgi:2-succinyl-5-enolpyruvyl-6-hydroxy-3-cyclohexene-1-carboxylate synthase